MFFQISPIILRNVVIEERTYFLPNEDRQFYLERLGVYCPKWQVDILAYCLMSNHIHLVLTPKTEESLQCVLKPLHMRYAQRINRAKGWKGHL